MKKYTNLNIFVPLGLIIFGIAWLKLAFDMGGAGIGDSSVWGTGATFPKFLLAIFIVLNIWILIAELLKASKTQAAETGEKDKGALRALLMMVILFIYTLILPIITYIPATIILLVVTMWLFNERRKLLLICMPVGFTLFLYLVFTYALKISLP